MAIEDGISRTVNISSRFDRWMKYQMYKDDQTRNELIDTALQKWYEANADVDSGVPPLSTTSPKQ